MPPANLTSKSVTAEMDIDTVLRHLAASPLVDGLAIYGPPTSSGEPGTDDDILALVSESPLHLAQIFTRIAARTADVLVIEAATYDQVIAGHRKLSAISVEGVFLRKMIQARVIVDRSGRLEKGREAARKGADWLRVPSFSGQYEQWFSLNFGLAHMKRTISSCDPTYLTAIDMLMASYLATTCRAYFDMRQLPWPGEKSAVRYFSEHAPDYLQVLRECLGEPSREKKLALYERLVTLTLEPFGECWNDDATAVAFAAPVHEPAQVADTLDFWRRLFR